MWADFSAASFLSLLVSCNVVLVGCAAIFRNPVKGTKNKAAGNRFSLLLICAGFLLGLFTLFNLGMLSYQGLPKLFHDLIALFFAFLVPDYVRSALQRRSLGWWLVLPALGYIGAWMILGERFQTLIEVSHLILLGICCSGIALAVYLRHLATSFRKTTIWKRVPAIDLLMGALLAIYALQAVYLLNQEQFALYLLAPSLGTVLFGLFFGIFIFTPEAVNVFLGPIVPTAGTEKTQRKALTQILEKITASELYADTELSVTRLAGYLDYSPRKLSRVINSETGKSFNHFINSLRIAKAKALLESREERQVSIEAIALICGFKSRSAFYAAFQRETGISPGNYRSRVQ